MDGSGKWLKSVITPRKLDMNDSDIQEKVSDKRKKKWRPWRSSSEGLGSSLKNAKQRQEGVASKNSDSSFLIDEVFMAAMAAVVRAPPKDFMLIKQELAAIRIQAAFRAFLARQALKALKAVVRLQAIFRGRQVRKQAAVTLRCMQALVRIQASVRARSVRMSPARQTAETLHQDESDPWKQTERGWCEIPGAADEFREELQMRQEAAVKMERTMVYSHSQKQSRTSACTKSKTTKGACLIKRQNQENSWLDSWIATKPLADGLMEKIHGCPVELTSKSRVSKEKNCNFHSPDDNFKVSRNNVTTRISAKPLQPCQWTPSSSATSSDVIYVDSPASTSYTSASPTMMSSNNPTMETTEERNIQTPRYMNLTTSTKAKQRAYRHSFNLERVRIGDSHSKSTKLMSGDARSSADSDCSINLHKRSPQSGMKDSMRHQISHRHK